MRKLIVIGGDLATGKSTFSRSIGKIFNLTVINKDKLKEILGDEFFAANREENLKLSRASFDIIEYLVRAERETLIIESNFKQSEMDRLEAIVSELNLDVLSLKFYGETATLHKRFLSRLDGDRHYVHRSQDFSDEKAFERCLNELRSVRYLGEVVEVNASDFAYFDDKALLKRIETFLSKE